MAKLSIIYYSGSGNTEQMADLIGEGAESAGVEVVKSQVEAAEESLAEADFVALGSPSTGSEEVAPEIVEYIERVKDKLAGKKIGVFGSYDWGFGEWMNMWIEELKNENIEVVGEGCVVHLTPDDDEKIEKCKNYGIEIVK